jgi:hypothetical protein
LSGNNFPAQYPSKLQHDPYAIQQQLAGQTLMDDSIYREQPQMTRNDWSQMMQQQQQSPALLPQFPQLKPQQTQQQQSNTVWPEKLAKHIPGEEKAGKKKGQSRDSEYSEEYIEGDESQSEGDESTTTEAPKKVKNTLPSTSVRIHKLLIMFVLSRNSTNTKK